MTTNQPAAELRPLLDHIVERMRVMLNFPATEYARGQIRDAILAAETELAIEFDTRHQPPAVPLSELKRYRFGEFDGPWLLEKDVLAALATTPATGAGEQCQGCIAAHAGYRIYNYLHTCKESDKARERITQIVIEWERDLSRKGMKPEHLDSLVDRIAALTTTPATSEAQTAQSDPTVTVSASGVDPSLPTHCDHGVSLDDPCETCRTAHPSPTTGAIEAATNEIMEHFHSIDIDALPNRKTITAIISKHLPPEAPSISAAIATERERAARIADKEAQEATRDEALSNDDADRGRCHAAMKIAAAIRALL